MLLIRFTLLTIGLTYLLTQSSVFVLLRVWINEKSPLLGSLVYCPACSGYWVGFTLWFVGVYPLPTILGPIDAGVAACGLMATWALAFLRTSSWELEQHAAPKE